jgi:hypothetical protein
MNKRMWLQFLGPKTIYILYLPIFLNKWMFRCEECYNEQGKQKCIVK